MHIYIFSELKLSARSNPEYEAPELQPLCSKVTQGLKSVVIQAHTTLFYGRQLSQSHEWQVNSDQTFLEISLSPWPLIKFLHIHDTKSNIRRHPHTLPDLVPCIHMIWISETQRQISWDIPGLTCLGTSCWSHRTFWKNNPGICQTHGVSPSLLSNTMPVHEGADWHIQVKREQGPKHTMNTRWLLKHRFLSLRANIPCRPSYPGVICKAKLDVSSLMMGAHVPKISAFCPWNLRSYSMKYKE